MNQRKKRAKVSERLRSAYCKGHKDAQTEIAKALVDSGINAATHNTLFSLLVARALPVVARCIASSPAKNFAYTLSIDGIPTAFQRTKAQSAIDRRAEFVDWFEGVNAEMAKHPEIERETIDLVQINEAGIVVEHMRLIGARGPWLGAADDADAKG